MTRSDGRTKRSVFATDQEWIRLRLVAAQEAERRGERVSPSDVLHMLVTERLEREDA